MQTRTYTPTCFCRHSARNSGQDGGCYLALDSMTYQASCQAMGAIFYKFTILIFLRRKIPGQTLARTRDLYGITA
jgi:hypothetical protein